MTEPQPNDTEQPGNPDLALGRVTIEELFDKDSPEGISGTYPTLLGKARCFPNEESGLFNESIDLLNKQLRHRGDEFIDKIRRARYTDLY